MLQYYAGARLLEKMSAKQEVLRLFAEPSCSVLQLSELQQGYRERVGQSEASLQTLLQELVESGLLKCRVVPPAAASSEPCTIYWLSSDRARATPSRSGTPLSAALRERLKRSRPKFVSPLLSTKRPRIVAYEGPPDTSTGGRLGSQICPVGKTEPPVGKTDPPVGKTEPPVGKTESPVGKTEPPVGKTEPPVGKTEPPMGKTEPPVGKTEPPVGKLEPPVARLDFSQCSEDDIKVAAPQCPATHPAGATEEERRQQLLRQKRSLEKQLEQQLERRRKLRMVKLHRTKNDRSQLSALTDKWRGVAQEAAEQLLAQSSLQPPPSMAQLLSHLHIDPSTIHYSLEEESFY